ncbi:MAG: restriction endonuclease Sau96I [Bacteroidetes bacterium]|nr:restriction endonuclease Sau96I [Bacteroidota bacterium]
MANQYLNYISDEHLLNCINNLYQSYQKAKSDNYEKMRCACKSDTIRLMFDAKFNDTNEEDLIQSEILRQIDKSINNSIGTFHEQILGGIEGFEVGNLSSFDVKAKDNTLFALFQFDPIPSKFQDAIFEKLAKQAQLFRQASCYLVDFTREDDYIENWAIKTEESSVSHKRVYKISGTRFYEVVTGEKGALDRILSVCGTFLDTFLNVYNNMSEVLKTNLDYNNIYNSGNGTLVVDFLKGKDSAFSLEIGKTEIGYFSEIRNNTYQFCERLNMDEVNFNSSINKLNRELLKFFDKA